MPGHTGAHDAERRGEYKVKATSEAQRDAAYRRHFLPTQTQDAHCLRMLLALTYNLGRWPPGVQSDPGLVSDLGFARHSVTTDGRTLVFFSWQANGDKGDRQPALRVFFYFHFEGPQRVAFVVHVVEESDLAADPEGVEQRAAFHIRAHKARGGHS